MSLKKYLLLFILLFLFSVVFLILRNKNYNLLHFFSNIRNKNISSELNTVVEKPLDVDSPFSNYIFDNEVVNNDGGSYSEKVKESKDIADVVLLRLEIYGNSSWGEVISDGQVVVQVISEDGYKKFYKILYSKNPSLEYDTGDIFKLNPVLSEPEALVMTEGYSMYFDYSVNDIGSFEDDFLKTGDNVVFTCKSFDCSDGLLNWVLVIRG